MNSKPVVNKLSSDKKSLSYKYFSNSFRKYEFLFYDIPCIYSQ